MADISYQAALSRAAALCSRSEKCLSDIRKKLFTWGLAESHHQKLLDYLVDQKYIDEERFTRFFVRDKFRFNQWGRIKIRYHLDAKRIPDQIIESILDVEINPVEYKDLALNLTKAKVKTIKAENDFERKGKVMRFLAGKGFEPDIIISVVDQII